MSMEKKMKVITCPSRSHIPIKIWGHDMIEPNAIEQAKKIASLPIAHRTMALMPDAHYGKGTPIGTVFAAKGAIVPSVVSSDIGCGMTATRLPEDFVPGDIDKIFSKLMQVVRIERFDRSGVSDDLIWSRNLMQQSLSANCSAYDPFYESDKFQRTWNQFGTLGGGNHFVSLDVDQEGQHWIVCHSGSRGVGGLIAKTYSDKAKQLCEMFRSDLPDKNLAFLPMEHTAGQEYFWWMEWATRWAKSSREWMVWALMDTLGLDNCDVEDFIDTPHNFAEELSDHVYGDQIILHRKGATPAIEGKLAVVPGSMTTHSYIVRGKSNKNSWNSCSHGAGRPFSRTESRKRIEEGVDPCAVSQAAQADTQVYGVEDFSDEVGSSYKDIEAVMEAQSDLCEPVYKLRSLGTLKG